MSTHRIYIVHLLSSESEEDPFVMVYLFIDIKLYLFQLKIIFQAHVFDLSFCDPLWTLCHVLIICYY